MSKPSVVLSPEEHDRVVELVKQGRTIKGIADEFGVTPKGVASYLKRNNIERPEHRNGETDRQKAALQELLDRSKEVRENEKRERDKRVSLQLEPPREPFDPTPTEYNMRMITLAEKKQYDCAWIIGDPKKHYRYCGNTTIGVGGPYCEYHKGISRNKQQTAHPKPYAPVNHK
jgi:hypothetical protein